MNVVNVVVPCQLEDTCLYSKYIFCVLKKKVNKYMYNNGISLFSVQDVFFTDYLFRYLMGVALIAGLNSFFPACNN
jgi:hypothetical protein